MNTTTTNYSQYDYLIQMDAEAFDNLHAKLQARLEELKLMLQDKQAQADGLMQIYLRAKLQIDYQQPTSGEEQEAFVRFPDLQKEMSALRAEKDEIELRLNDINFIQPLLIYRKKVAAFKPKLTSFLELWHTNYKSKKNQLQLFSQLQALAYEGSRINFHSEQLDKFLHNNSHKIKPTIKAIVAQNIDGACTQLKYLYENISPNAKAIQSHNFYDRKDYTYQELIDGALVDDLFANLTKNIEMVEHYIASEEIIASEQNHG